MYLCMYVCMYVCMDVCMYVGMNKCLYVCMYVFMYVCMCERVGRVGWWIMSFPKEFAHFFAGINQDKDRGLQNALKKDYMF